MLLKELKNNEEVNKVSIGGEENIIAISLENAELAIGKNPKNLLELFELLCGIIWRE